MAAAARRAPPAPRRRAPCRSRRPCVVASAQAVSAPLTAERKAEVKQRLLVLGATTDRGSLLFTQQAYAPLDEYGAADVAEVRSLLGELVDSAEGAPVDPGLVSGEWELVLATKQLFRSSPFFMAVQEAFGDARAFGQKSSELFFRLHELQVKSWGVSTIGKVAQKVDLERGVMESYFDTVIFALTVIPIVGWFKLLPTFGGRVLTKSDNVALDPETGRVGLELQTTRVDPAPGVPLIPLVSGLLMGRDYPVNFVWKLLPWNRGRAPTAATYVKFVDEDFRVTADRDGEYFVYVRRPEGTFAGGR